MTNSSPVVDSTTSYTMVKLSSGANSTVPSSSGNGQLSTGTGYYGTYYPSYPNYSPYPYTTGYTCPRCGTYVYYGNYHSCYPTVISYPVYIQSPPVDLTPLLEKLDELTDEVKKLRKKQKKLDK